MQEPAKKSGTAYKKTLWYALIVICSLVCLHVPAFAQDTAGMPAMQWMNSVAAAINQHTPVQIDSYTRLDSVQVMDAHTFLYNYTLSGVDTNNAKIVAYLKQALKQQTLQNYKTNPSMAEIRKHNLRLGYNYRDAQGKSIIAFAINPADF